jgi:pimeloyl-ACP methyl ester carboxylesterase
MQLPYRGEIKVLDEPSRTQAPGSFLGLSRGLTHYQLSGPESGEIVVLIHGIAGPMGIWNTIADSLAAKGLRVLQYDLFGRGYSDRPAIKYDQALFLEQLSELIDILRFPQPMTIVGWSLGGMLAAAYAAEQPGAVKRLILIAPAGLDVTLPAAARIGMLPFFGEFLISLAGRRIVINSLTSGLSRREFIQEYIHLICDQMQYRGYLRAFLSTLRYCAYRDSSSEYRAVGELGIPVQLITGMEDRSIPQSVSEKIIDLIPNLDVRRIEGAGHIPMLETPDTLRALLLEFIDSTTYAVD